MSFETEDMEHDQATPVLSHSIRVFVDEHIIGCIQKMKIEADCEKTLPEIEFTFPDLEALDYDYSSYKLANPGIKGKPYFINEIEEHIKVLEQAPNIKIRKEGVDNGENIVHLKEVGTDGFIDSIPMSRRNK